MLSDDLIKGARAAAGYLGLSERSVYHMTEQGQLPVIRIGKSRCLFYRKSDLERVFQAVA
jgi:excisionase family DNA binding protein